MRKPWCCAAFVVMATVVGPAVAWNNTGHMVMARITYEQLSAAQRATLAEILAAHPRFTDDFERRIPPDVRRSDAIEEWRFAYAATWPDTVRHFGYVKPVRAREALVERYNRGRWHYINLPLSIDARGVYRTQVAAGAVRVAQGGTVPTATDDPDDIVAALERISRSWSTASDTQRAVALCWLLHLMGDLHQPLHTVMLVAPGTLEPGDRGGNEIRVHAGRHGSRNLHALWDGALGKSIRWQDLTELTQRLQRDQSRPKRPTGADRGGIEFAHWAEQGRTLAREVVYVTDVRKRVAAQSARRETPDFWPDDYYLARMTDRSRSQIILAARRTVRVLSSLGPR